MLPVLEILDVVVLQFLIEWQREKLTGQGKLFIYFVLADVKVLYTEEAFEITPSVARVIAETDQVNMIADQHCGQHGPAVLQALPCPLPERTDRSRG
jgi:hypothetical protein